VSGGITRSVSTITQTTTLGASGATDYVTFYNGASGAPVLPSAVSNINKYTVKNISSTAFLIATTSSQTIDGSTPIAGDANYSSISLLMLGNDVNNSTNFLDSSPNPKAPTRVGSPVISTTQSKFGGSSMYFPNTANSGGNLIHFTSSEFAVGTGNFTAEAWVYPTAFSAYNNVCGTRNTSGNNATGYNLFIVGTGELCVYSDGFYAMSPAGTITLNTWQHIAVCRNGGTTRTFKNGTQVGTTTTFDKNLTNTNLSVGSYNGDNSQPFCGYIDDLRITNIARYTTSSFTAPTAQLATNAVGVGFIEANKSLSFISDGANWRTV
jgi:hypothetical protein